MWDQVPVAQWIERPPP